MLTTMSIFAHGCGSCEKNKGAHRRSCCPPSCTPHESSNRSHRNIFFIVFFLKSSVPASQLPLGCVIIPIFMCLYLCFATTVFLCVSCFSVPLFNAPALSGTPSSKRGNHFNSPPFQGGVRRSREGVGTAWGFFGDQNFATSIYHYVKNLFWKASVWLHNCHLRHINNISLRCELISF